MTTPAPDVGGVPDWLGMAGMGWSLRTQAHRSIDKADHYARDNVGIMKPPDVTWWPWLLLAGLLVSYCIVIWLKKKK